MDETEEMVRLLLTKAKMLSYHCPRCNLPLFEKDKKVICVRCGGVRVEEEKKGDKGKDPDLCRTRDVLEKKKEDFLKRLDSENDPVEVGKLLEAISKIEKSLKDLYRQS